MPPQSPRVASGEMTLNLFHDHADRTVARLVGGSLASVPAPSDLTNRSTAPGSIPGREAAKGTATGRIGGF